MAAFDTILTFHEGNAGTTVNAKLPAYSEGALVLVLATYQNAQTSATFDLGTGLNGEALTEGFIDSGAATTAGCASSYHYWVADAANPSETTINITRTASGGWAQITLIFDAGTFDPALVPLTVGTDARSSATFCRFALTAPASLPLGGTLYGITSVDSGVAITPNANLPVIDISEDVVGSGGWGTNPIDNSNSHGYLAHQSPGSSSIVADEVFSEDIAHNSGGEASATVAVLIPTGAPAAAVGGQGGGSGSGPGAGNGSGSGSSGGSGSGSGSSNGASPGGPGSGPGTGNNSAPGVSAPGSNASGQAGPGPGVTSTNLGNSNANNGNHGQSPGSTLGLSAGIQVVKAVTQQTLGSGNVQATNQVQVVTLANGAPRTWTAKQQSKK